MLFPVKRRGEQWYRRVHVKTIAYPLSSWYIFFFKVFVHLQMYEYLQTGCFVLLFLLIYPLSFSVCSSKKITYCTNLLPVLLCCLCHVLSSLLHVVLLFNYYCCCCYFPVKTYNTDNLFWLSVLVLCQCISVTLPTGTVLS